LEISSRDLLDVGERVLHLERLINLKLGASAADDQLPEMFYTVPVPSGPNTGERLDKFSNSVHKFYRAMGWDKEGIPGKETLRSMKLDSLLTGK